MLVATRAKRRDALVLLPGKESPEDQRVSRPLLTVAGDAASYLTDSGDINGDGRADLVLVDRYYGSSPTAVPSRKSPVAHPALLLPAPSPGGVFVVFGSATPRAVDLDQMTSDEGYVIRGADAPDRLRSASIAGDLNGDARPELLIDAPGARRYCGGGGGAYVGFSGSRARALWLGNPGERALRLDPGRKERGLVALPAGDVGADGRADIRVYAEQVRGRTRWGEPKPVSARVYTVTGRDALPQPYRPHPATSKARPRAWLREERQAPLGEGFCARRRHAQRARARGLYSTFGRRKATGPVYSRRTARSKRVSQPISASGSTSARVTRSGVAAARLWAAWREEFLDSGAARSAGHSGPAPGPQAFLAATARLTDRAGNRCSAQSGIAGSVDVF